MYNKKTNYLRRSNGTRNLVDLDKEIVISKENLDNFIEDLEEGRVFTFTNYRALIICSPADKPSNLIKDWLRSHRNLASVNK